MRTFLDTSSSYLCVHFIECDEYLENNNSSSKRDVGDNIYGELKLALVTDFATVNNTSESFFQSIKDSSNITATATVNGIIDNDTITCSIGELGQKIIVEFETNVEIEMNTMIRFNGSLELELE